MLPRAGLYSLIKMLVMSESNLVIRQKTYVVTVFAMIITASLRSLDTIDVSGPSSSSFSFITWKAGLRKDSY